MRLTSKDIEILKYLISKEGILPIKNIGSFFGMDDRAVRYHIKKIQEFVKGLPTGCIESIRRKGIYLTEKDRIKKWLEEFERKIDLENYQYSAEESIAFMILKLSISAELVDITKIQQILELSNPTVRAYLRRIDQLLFEKDLKLAHLKRKGYKISGNRRILEKYFLETLLSSVDLIEVIHFMKTVGETQTKAGELLLSNIFDLSDVERATYEVEKLENESQRPLGDLEYLTWIIHRVFDMRLFYSTEGPPKKERSSPDEISYNDFVGELIDKVERELSINLRAENSGFERVLREHIKNLNLRIQANEVFQNPIYENFVEEYGEFTHLLESIIQELGNEKNIAIDKQEISLIAILFLSEIQKNQEQQTKFPAVLVICPEGRVFSNIVANKIRSLFESRKLDIVTVHKVSKKQLEDYDIVFTTIKLSKELEEKTIFISPLFTKEDLKTISECMPWKLNAKHYELKKFSEIMETIKENATVKDWAKLEFMLLDVLNSKEILNGREENFEINFSLDSVKIVSKAVNWEKGIDISCEHLILEGCIESRYCEKIKSNTREYGIYMNVSPGIFIAHAGGDDGCLKNGISVTKFEKGLKIIPNQKVPIDFIITVALNNTSMNTLLEKTVNFIRNKEKTEELRNLKNEETIYDFLRINYLKI